MSDTALPTRANPSPDAYERARKVVHGWLATLHPSVVIPEDDGGQLIDSLAWEIDDSGFVDGLRRAAFLARNSKYVDGPLGTIEGQLARALEAEAAALECRKA